MFSGRNNRFRGNAWPYFILDHKNLEVKVIIKEFVKRSQMAIFLRQTEPHLGFIFAIG